MSLLNHEDRTCACGATLRVLVADSVNAGRHPHLRKAILDGTFHRYRCELCGRTLVIDRALFYFDFDRRQFVGVYPVEQLADADACARATATTFEVTLGREAPAPIAQLAPQFLVRVCFGYDELREKLLCDEAGLSDLVLEELKCELLASDPAFRGGNVVTLWLAAVTDELLCFRPAAIGAAVPLQGVEVERALYDEIAARGDAAILAARPGLASGPHVSLLRLVRWATAPAASASGS